MVGRPNTGWNAYVRDLAKHVSSLLNLLSLPFDSSIEVVNSKVPESLAVHKASSHHALEYSPASS